MIVILMRGINSRVERGKRLLCEPSDTEQKSFYGDGVISSRLPQTVRRNQGHCHGVRRARMASHKNLSEFECALNIDVKGIRYY